jgi:hypothetical protein
MQYDWATAAKLPTKQQGLPNSAKLSCHILPLFSIGVLLHFSFLMSDSCSANPQVDLARRVATYAIR